MSWTNIDDPELAKQAKKESEIRKQNYRELAKKYHRVFTSEDGQSILSDLTKRFIYDNDTQFGSTNINYEAAYHDGESGVVKFVINQIKQAEIL